MQLKKCLSALLLVSLLIAGCKSDDDEATPTKTCPLSSVSLELDPTTSLGLFDITYNSNGRITEAGLQTYEFSYDANGNVTNALLPSDNFTPRVENVFTYNGDKIASVSQNWGEAPNVSERYVFTPTYDSNGYVTTVLRTGLGGDQTLNYSFDSNGNALTWTDPIFQDVHQYTFGTGKGIVTGLTHNQAFAYSLALGQPFFHFNNEVKSESIDDNGTIESATFSNNAFSSNGFQATASDPNGKTYIFQYECD